ncbi:MAG: RNA polymerase sigma factor [Sedimentisphaeraceae bacterium JB056]
MQRYRNGDTEAISILISRYQNRLYNTILKMCHNHEDALELTQDSFVKVIESIDKFEGKSSFYTYLFRVGVNLTINFCNRRKKIGFTTIDGDKNDTGGKVLLKDYLVDGSIDDPADIVANQEAVEILRECISELEDKYRTILVLRDIEQMSYEQIAEVLTLEIGTVKSRLFRARAMLKDKLTAVFGEQD